jgi:Mrp family chromosome partitioning ATPase
MFKKIDVTQLRISIARLIRLGLKNYRFVFYYAALCSFLAFGYTTSPFMERGTYLSSGSIFHNSNANAIIRNTIVEAVTSTEFSERVSLHLEENGLSLNDGTFLSAETIKSSLTVIPVPNSLRITINFTYPDETLSITILNQIIDESINYTNTTFTNLNNGVFLGEYATSSTFEGTPSITFIAIGALVGAAIGGLIGVVFHAVKGTIYSIQDAKEFEISSFYLQMKIKRQRTFKGFFNLLGFGIKNNFEREQTKLILQGLVTSDSFTSIQNNLESTRNKPEEPLTTLMVTPMATSTLSMVAFTYARQSSTQGRKTILIDFDLKDVPFTKYIETYQIETKKKSSSKEGVSFLTLEENLDLYLPSKAMIPAKVIRDENTQDIIAQAKKRYDHIIILGPSLLPDLTSMSILSYVNSALIVVNAGKSTINELIKSVNLLIDNQLPVIETLIVEQKVQPTFSSLNQSKSSSLKSKPNVGPALTTNPSKKK